jgi:hypothetical protein
MRTFDCFEPSGTSQREVPSKCYWVRALWRKVFHTLLLVPVYSFGALTCMRTKPVPLFRWIFTSIKYLYTNVYRFSQKADRPMGAELNSTRLQPAIT